MKHMPQIMKYMTPMPHSIGQDIPVKKAFELMREYQVRHLPVQNGGRVVGVLTDRDIKLASSFAGAGDLKVEDVMTPDPYIVRPETLLNEVVAEMAEHKYGCTLIQQSNNKLVGIFTTVDALRVFSDVLKASYTE